MKIAIATGPWFPVPTLQGGAHHRLWQGLAEEFAAAGHQVTILCRSYPSQPDTENINNVEYIRKGGFSQSPNIWFDLLKDLAYAFLTFPTLPHADILVINDFWLPVFAPLRSRVGKIVVSVGRFPKGQYPLYARVDLFTVLSQAIWDGIAQQYPNAIPRMRLIPNPVDTRVFYPSAQSKPERAEKVILYVGRIHPEKGIHLLLDAFALLSQQDSPAKLKILGPVKGSQGGGGEGYFHQLKLKAEGLKVEFIEPIFDTKQLAKIYRSADLFCYPSLAEKGEAFPIAPLEAMVCGLVPIVSDLSCFKDYIEDGETGYFFNHRDSNAAQNLANTLTKAISSSKDNICQMSDNASQKASEFSYERIAKSYLSNFENLLNSGKKSG
ncbi:glycosyltransferase family 4 protein [Nostocaceae cyanobacterium CENA357]|uniref:Glycosyltransferase family 4 protein n=1 Tax=Atlanticothrix silvestris CENA357 TaxID=1725252 RepID=A0A8J7HID2_9CYAN|nr:glycosyltransferase family 4 protein [Atlanticothrix silvestris]MBH8555313.1 glycosyltransferase family 4 protein [Atlanticothrix silvestris CENA357]